MSNYIALDCVAHQNLKVCTQYDEVFGGNTNHALVFPTEFEVLHREYPIFFRRKETSGYYAICILGFDKNENLFLENGNWAARSIPATFMRGPFALQLTHNENALQTEAEPIVMVDLDNARINPDVGESIFQAHGGYTPYFKEILQAMRKIHVGNQSTESFFAILDKFKLIEPIEIKVDMAEKGTYNIADLFTISRERLAELCSDELHELNSLGLLEHCFSVVSSAGNMSHLVNMKIRSSVSSKS
ncbi:SapC family protein [Aliiglaciecola sp. 2_MG-2023]|uniref:SapC family protein n=1 Tax=unclassified Aliiglaciecola TaxID=2593648 RepID=UPI0026E2442F|nr:MULTISPECIES: SapC family protein [unclassified Aliiglaciecola]MDO6712397.1 SapC family protein [Aliiglaciecola sp. 2_MG-2023]MDO6753391.1 SapC family protein [Aliiglaciecola sp. 1_MG-2023]